MTKARRNRRQPDAFKIHPVWGHADSGGTIGPRSQAGWRGKRGFRVKTKGKKPGTKEKDPVS